MCVGQPYERYPHLSGYSTSSALSFETQNDRVSEAAAGFLLRE